MGGGPESQINTWNFVRKTSHFFKKTKCPKQPKKQNKPNFHFSLSGVPNVRGGWVGSDVWDKVPKNVFFWHLPLVLENSWYLSRTHEAEFTWKSTYTGTQGWKDRKTIRKCTIWPWVWRCWASHSYVCENLQLLHYSANKILWKAHLAIRSKLLTF